MTDKSMTRWTAEEDALLIEMLSAGASYKEMARALDRGVRSVDHRRMRLGLKRYREKYAPTAKAERAAIVKWLRKLDQGNEFHDAGWIADEINSGEHLK